MIAFDGGILTRRGVEMVATSPLFGGLPVHVLMSVKPRKDAPGNWSGPGTRRRKRASRSLPR